MDNVYITTSTHNIMKNVDTDKRLFTAVTLRPDVVDSQGHIYSEEVVTKAAHDYVTSCMNTNLQHKYDLEKSDMEIVESFIAPCDMSYPEGDVMKGDWVMTAKINNDALWEACKNGEFTGFSVGCSGVIEEL